MTYTQTGNCPKCGAPIWHPTVWGGIIPPPATPSCGCSRRGKSESERTLDELVTLLVDYVGETGKSESAVEVLGRLLEELEGYRRNVLAADVRRHLRMCGNDPVAMSFALLNRPKYDNVPGAIIQRIINAEKSKMEAVE